MAPTFDEHGDVLELNEQRRMFIEMDKFVRKCKYTMRGFNFTICIGEPDSVRYHHDIFCLESDSKVLVSREKMSLVLVKQNQLRIIHNVRIINRKFLKIVLYVSQQRGLKKKRRG